MATTFTLGPGVFPAGTTVEARPRSNWPASQQDAPTGTPGSATASATTAADGTTVFTGLADNARYVASGTVDGATRYVKFSTGSAGSETAADVDVVTLPKTATATAAAGTANVTTSSAEAVATNSNRAGIQVVNNSDTDISLALGAAAVAGQGIVLKANGGSWDGRVSGVLWTGQVRAIHAGTGTKTLAYVEV